MATDIHPNRVRPMTKAPIAKMPNAVVGASAEAAVSAMNTAPATMRKPMGSTVMFDAWWVHTLSHTAGHKVSAT